MIKITIQELEEQEFDIVIGDTSYSLTVYYKPNIRQWFLDIENVQYGIRLCVGTLLIDAIKPFNFIVKSLNTIDPQEYNDFTDDYELLAFERNEIAEIRGYDVR